MKTILEVLGQAHKSLIFLEKTLVIILLFAMVLLSFGQVVFRNIFQTGFMWVDEVLRVQVLWLTFLGAGLAAEYNRHVKIDVLSHVMGSGAMSKTIDILAQLFAMAVGILLFYGAYDYIQVERQYATPGPIWNVPDYVWRMVIPYFFLVLSIRSVINVGRIIQGTHRRTIEP